MILDRLDVIFLFFSVRMKLIAFFFRTILLSVETFASFS